MFNAEAVLLKVLLNIGGINVLMSPSGSEFVQLKGQDERALSSSTILALFYTVRRVSQSSCLLGSSPLLVGPVAGLLQGLSHA